MFVKHVPEKDLQPRKYKDSSKLNNKEKISNTIKILKNLKRHIKKDIQMANKDMKRCSASLVIRDMQIKSPDTSTIYFLKGLNLKG